MTAEWNNDGPSSDNGDALLDRPTMPSSGPVHRTGSESDTYIKLADAFLNSSSSTTKRRIARRLDVAQNSESALIREHAAQAIGRIRAIDSQGFDEALTLEPEPQAAKG